MRVVSVYLGPGRELRGFIIELLPRFDVHVYQNNGFLALGWLCWILELQWRYRECTS